MPIVFDEVVGSVEPERGAASEQQQSGDQQRQTEDDTATVRNALLRIEQRSERLKAD